MSDYSKIACTRVDESEKARFMSKVQVLPEGCWLWKGSTSRTGYPMFRYAGQTMYATRVSLMLYKGEAIELKPKEQVWHRRDCPSRPTCVSPEHLRVMTRSDYSAEMRRAQENLPKLIRKVLKAFRHVKECAIPDCEGCREADRILLALSAMDNTRERKKPQAIATPVVEIRVAQPTEIRREA